jgi:O-antigen/teichoic acid export membrane protein
MPSLQHAALVGTRWFAGGRAIAELVAFGASLVLARLVPPAEFGRAVVATAFFAVATTVLAEGFATPLVRRRDPPRSEFEVAGMLSLAIGLALVVLFALVLPVVVAPVFGDRTAELVRLLAPVFAFNAVAAVPRALLQRKLDFRVLGAFEVLSLIAGTGTTLGLALAGLEGEAIVAGMVARAVAEALLLSAAARPPLPRWRPGVARELLGFGSSTALASVVFNVWRNVDYAIIGARLGAQEAGLFWRAYMLAYEYQGKVTGVLQRIAYPIYARSDDLEHMKRIRMRILRVQAAVLFPPLVGLVALAPTLVPVLYGAEWHAAIVPTQLLAIGGLATVVSTGLGALFTAAGRPGLLVVMNTANALTYATVVLLVAPLGISAVALGAAAFSVASFVAGHLVLERTIGVSFRDVLADVVPAATASAALLAATYPLARVLESAGTPAALIILAVATTGAVVYLAVLRGAFGAAWEDLVLLMASVLGRRRAAAAPVSGHQARAARPRARDSS